ncbi:inorganic pyrophosphatase [Shimwellia pseudoproteus]|uniref:DHHA2 domain-containing protein n=1 Tax=Shimwellia pseudoproteus TaxID=570012 RepID=UPI0018EE4000|nr:DHH family phosphoesterase [Shimwellia pseudoproteus]MBJ3813895.1 inorganic pyrophosphatase [Shimwellia pseudoproteus]
MLYVFGHLNPDTDSICSAIVAAEWLHFRGEKCQAFRLGDINPETRFVLEQAGVAAPALLSDDLTDRNVWLVDFSEFEQGPDSLPHAQIRGIIDHHRLGTVMTKEPADICVKPLGCCCTVLWQQIMLESDMPVSGPQAILMLGAILSDTVGLTSSTTTEQDRHAVDALFAIAGIDRTTFTRQLLDAKTDLSGYSAVELLDKDAKNYQFDDNTVKVAQLEITSHNANSDQMKQTISALKQSTQPTVLMLTEIDTRTSRLYYSWESADQPVVLENAMSRKKDALPWLTENKPWNNPR